jgi:hypothetical protein
MVLKPGLMKHVWYSNSRLTNSCCNTSVYPIAYKLNSIVLFGVRLDKEGHCVFPGTSQQDQGADSERSNGGSGVEERQDYLCAE